MASSKLTCVTHKRRVLVFRFTGAGDIVTIHRNGKAKDLCPSSTFTIGDRTLTAAEIVRN